jgi:hypothetical protein
MSMERVKAILMDPEKKWFGGWPGPTGGWIAILTCEHEFKGVDLTKRPVLGTEICCIECKREEKNGRQRKRV